MNACCEVVEAMRRRVADPGRRVMQFGGVLLIIVGLMQVTGVWASMIASMQGVVANWQTPL